MRNPLARRGPTTPRPRRASTGELLRAALDLALPARCAGCNSALRSTAREPLCANCQLALPYVTEPGCASCDEPLGVYAGVDHQCEACLDRASPLATCRAALWLEADAARWIHAFKYPPSGLLDFDASARSVMRSLARIAARRYRGARPLVVPVPLHPRRLRARSFNQAATLAREVARELCAPLAMRGLERIRDTPSQTGLDRPERRRNIAGAFRSRIVEPLDAPILLVDDVVTTGSTLEEAARTLRRAGAPTVSAICVGRARRSRARLRDSAVWRASE